MADQITFDDFFDFRNQQEFIQAIDKIETAYNDLSKAVIADNASMEKSVMSLYKELEKAEKTLKATDTQQAKNGATAKQSAAEIAGFAEQIAKLQKKQDDQLKTIKELEVANKKLQDSIKKTTVTYDAQEGSLARLKEELKDAKKVYESLGDTVGKTSKEYKEAEKRFLSLQNQVTDANKTNREAVKAFNATESSINDLRSRLRTATRTWDTFTAAERDADIATGKVSKEIDDLTKEIKELENATGRNQRSVGNYGLALEGVGGILNSVGGGVSSLGSVLQGAAGGGAFAIVTGLIEGASEALGAMNEALKQTAKDLRTVQQISGKSGAGLGDLTAEIQAVSDVFGEDFKEVLNVVNVLVNEFGVTYSEALQKVNDGLATGANINGQYLDNLREYATQQKAANITLDEFNKLSILSTQKGLYNDKAIDAVKEMTIRLGSLTKTQRATLDTLGADSIRVQEAFKRSSIEGVELLVKVINEAEDAGKNVQSLISDLGGAPLEDLGRNGREVIATFRSMNTEITEAGGILQEQVRIEGELNRELVDLSVNTNNFARSSAKLWTQFKTVGLGAINAVIQALETIDEKMARDISKSFSGTQEIINKGVASIRGEIGQLEGTISKLSKTTVDAKNSIDKFDKATFSTTVSQGQYGSRTKINTALVEKFRQELGLLAEEQLGLGDNRLQKALETGGISGIKQAVSVLKAQELTLEASKFQLSELVTAEKTLTSETKERMSELSGGLDKAQQKTKALIDTNTELFDSLQLPELDIEEPLKFYSELLKIEDELSKNPIIFLTDDERKKLETVSKLLDAIDDKLGIKRKLVIETEIKTDAFGVSVEADKKLNDAARTRAEDQAQLRQDNLDAIKENGQAILAEAANLANALLDNDKQKLQKELEQVEYVEQQKLAAAKATSRSADELTQREGIIAKEALEEKRRIAIEIAKIERKQFFISQANALAQIAINTALAITKTLAIGGAFATPLAISIGVLGALQAATVIAQRPPEIPAFRMGRDNGSLPATLAKFNEEGREIGHHKESGLMWELGSGKGGTEFGMIPEGTSVYTASQSDKIRRSNDNRLNDISHNNAVNMVVNLDHEAIGRTVGNAVKKQPVYNTVIESNGAITNHVQIGNKRVNYRNDRTNFKKGNDGL